MNTPKNWEEQKLLLSLAEEIEELTREDANNEEGMTTSDFQGSIGAIIMKYAKRIQVKDEYVGVLTEWQKAHE